jgi:type IV pilus assembly protein PilM
MVRALHRHGTPDETVVYVSIGGLTNLAVAEGLTCHFTRVVGGGLEALAVELAERRALSLEQARAGLEHTGLEQPVDDLDGYAEHAEITDDARAVLLDGVRRIAADIRNSIDFHYGYGSERPIARCVLTGPAAAVAGFAAALSAELGLPVESGRIDAPPGLDAERVTVAAGLAVAEAVAR